MTRTDRSSHWSFFHWSALIVLMGTAVFLAMLPLASEPKWPCTLEMHSGLLDTVLLPVQYTVIQNGERVSSMQLIGYHRPSEEQEVLRRIAEVDILQSSDHARMDLLRQLADRLDIGPAKEWIGQHITEQPKKSQSSNDLIKASETFLDRRKDLQAVEDSLGRQRKRMLDAGAGTPGGGLLHRTAIADLEKRQMVLRHEINTLIRTSDQSTRSTKESIDFQMTAPLSELVDIAQRELTSNEVFSDTNGILTWIYSSDQQIIGYQILEAMPTHALLTFSLEIHDENFFEGQTFTFHPEYSAETVDEGIWEGTIIALITREGSGGWLVQMDNGEMGGQASQVMKGLFVPTDHEESQTLADVLLSRRL